MNVQPLVINTSRRGALVTAISLTALVAGVVVYLVVDRSPAMAAAGALDDETAMGPVELAVENLDAMSAYYTDAVGLDTLERDDDSTTLGLGDVALLRLIPEDLDPRTAGTAGLYHSAILFSDEASLASALLSVANEAPESFGGAADHRVSQAFYFADPEGNGLELYVDRPEDQWEWNDGLVTMGSLPLDPNAFISEHLPSGTAVDNPEAVMGHVHLSVGDLDEAERFYSQIVGFDVTSRAEGAVFMSAGGYHHHLAGNVWNSPGATERTPSLGLARFGVTLADEAAMDALAARLDEAGVGYERDGEGIETRDPWDTVVRFTVR